MLREGLELATPEAELTEQKTEVRFGPREMDPAEAATYKDYYSDEIETYDRSCIFRRCGRGQREPYHSQKIRPGYRQDKFL